MKRIIIFVGIFLIIFLCLISCSSWHIKVEVGSKWESNDKVLRFSVINEDEAEGTLKIGQENIDVIVYFGPGVNDFFIVDKNNESRAAEGVYCYGFEKEIIIFKVNFDEIGINRQEIVLYRITD